MISALYWGVLRSKIKHKSGVHSQITISTALLTDIQTDRRTESKHSAVESVHAAGPKKNKRFSLVILMTIYNLCNLCTLRNLCQSDEYQKLIRDSFSSAEEGDYRREGARGATQRRKRREALLLIVCLPVVHCTPCLSSQAQLYANITGERLHCDVPLQIKYVCIYVTEKRFQK